MIRTFFSMALLAAALVLAGCSSAPVVTADKANSIRSLALLPMVNNTLDVDGPEIVRALLAVRLENHLYAVRPTAETDRILKDRMGLTLGSQLDMATTRQLCGQLGADAIVYGSLDDFSHKITGIYNAKRVRVRLKMDSCATGATIWKNGIGVKREVRAGESLLKKVPVVGDAVTAVGVVASVASSMSDKDDSTLPKLHGEDIAAPWEDISEDTAGAELNFVLGLGERIINKARNSTLLSETETALEILMNGYYDDGNEQIPCGVMCPLGPHEKAPDM